MNFEEAEARFRQLQARVQKGETISRAEYEEQVSQLAVQDDNGQLWEINPRSGKWMYFDGAEWVPGTPPGHDSSQVIPGFGAPTPQPTTPPPSAPPTPEKTWTPPPPPIRPTASTAPRAKPPEAVPPFKRVGQDKKTAAPLAGKAPAGDQQKPPRAPKERGASNRREWVPLAVAAVVLLSCAVLVFVGYNVAAPMLFPKPTPTFVAKVPTVTNTPVPTIVRLPSPTPIPPTPEPVLAKVIENTVNVRAEPSTKGKIISSLKKNNQITLVGRSEDAQWYQINIAGAAQPGWVFAATLQVVSGKPELLPVGNAAPAPTARPAGTQPTPTLTPIGVIPPTPKP